MYVPAGHGDPRAGVCFGNQPDIFQCNGKMDQLNISIIVSFASVAPFGMHVYRLVESAAI